MGASSSTEQISAEQREAESLAASTGALPMLQRAFSVLADPQTKTIPVHSLKQCFSLIFENPAHEAAGIPPNFHGLLSHLGSSIVDFLFLAEKGGVNWIEFLRGYVKCCSRMSASTSFNMLFRVFIMTVEKSGLPAKLLFDSDDVDGKISGFLMPADLLMLLWMCYIMTWNSENLESSGGEGGGGLPDLSHLVLSAVLACAEVGSELNPWDCDILSIDVQLPAGKIYTWAVRTVPSLPDCFTQFVQRRIQKSIASEKNLDASCSSVHELYATTECNTNLLTRERAWAISLTLRSTASEEILKVCFPSCTDGNKESLLYRSSLHGKGLNRFWSNVEGYNGPMLILIAGRLGDVHDNIGSARRCILGALTHQAFENKDMFYGSAGSLYAISPVFNVFSSSGKDKNFVYSHLHPTGRYDPKPKPVGLAFGGSIGNERVFIDEDFAKLTVRHHAVDKTYQPGSLFPSQGFLPTEAQVLDVEVWGLGDRTAKEMQTSHKKREQLFTEQRRKVDLKTFASWEDSPEKMMMDMMNDPNRVEREDR